jgi:hypothetical protein
MAMTKKIEHRLYGVLLCHFANAQTSDDAGLKYLENIKRVFGFPDSLPSSITGGVTQPDCNEFPTLKKFISRFSKTEKMIFDLIIKEKKILSEIDPVINNGEFRFKKYDPLKETLQYEHLYLHHAGYDDEGEPYADAEIDGTDDFTAEDIGGMFDTLSTYGGSLKREEILARLLSNINNLMNVGKDIDKLRGAISEKAYRNIRDLSEIYVDRILPEHQYITDLQNKLKIILDRVGVHSTNGSNEASGMLDDILTTYNEISKRNAHITKNGNIEIEPHPFRAEFFINRFDTSPVHCLKEYYTEPLAYCLVEFLSKPQNQRYLRKCLICEDYYIAGSVAREVCCEKTECSKLYDRFRKRWQRETEPEVYDATKSPEDHPAYE